MNETVWLINSERDNFRDFASYVVNLAENFFRNSLIRCRFDIEDDLPLLPCDLRTRRNLFLAVKEALDNILRHSEATLAEVKICRQHQELTVTIRDNGRGFDAVPSGVGNGLRNMKARTAEAGGRFVVKSQPGQGTTLEFRVPIQAPARLSFARFHPSDATSRRS